MRTEQQVRTARDVREITGLSDRRTKAGWAEFAVKTDIRKVRIAPGRYASEYGNAFVVPYTTNAHEVMADKADELAARGLCVTVTTYQDGHRRVMVRSGWNPDATVVRHDMRESA